MSRQRIFCFTKGEEEMNLIKILECSHYREELVDGKKVFDYVLKYNSDSLGICKDCKTRLKRMINYKGGAK